MDDERTDEERRHLTRRAFLERSGAAAAGFALSEGAAAAQERDAAAGEGEFSRYRPSRGGPPGSPTYMGKLVPGRREPGLAPVQVRTPDLGSLPHRMVDGVREFVLRCTPVEREFLPGYPMRVWGYEGSMPGPTIEAWQGERVRIVVQNELPEPTTVHWHGLELPIAMDGVPGLTQDLIPPGGSFTYEFDLHQTGSFFYHSHVAMQEAFGMVGLFVVHPQVAFEPTVDRDFALVFQNFSIPPNAVVADSMAMDWNWHTINGRSGPFATPLVCRLGERVRVRLLDFSPMQHHPIHLHGHTFWLTGTEAGRVPPEAWVPRNTTLVGVAMVQDFEFIAFNPGDWIFHCHMIHHMMNHMVRQAGPRMRGEKDVERYLAALPDRPEPRPRLDEPAFDVPGYPQKMRGMAMSHEAMARIQGRREARGMRADWWKAPKGLMTVLRVLPDELYERVMERDEPVAPGEIHEAIVRGDYAEARARE